MFYSFLLSMLTVFVFIYTLGKSYQLKRINTLVSNQQLKIDNLRLEEEDLRKELSRLRESCELYQNKDNDFSTQSFESIEEKYKFLKLKEENSNKIICEVAVGEKVSVYETMMVFEPYLKKLLKKHKKLFVKKEDGCIYWSGSSYDSFRNFIISIKDREFTQKFNIVLTYED